MIKLESGQNCLWQWNTGQRLVVSYPPGTVLDFTTGGTDAIRRDVYERDGTLYADIPNVLLQSAGPLYVYVHHIEGDQLTTVLEAIYPIRSQPKPPDYIDDEQEALLWHQLDERITRLEESGAGGPVPYTIGTGLKLVVEGISKTLVVDTANVVEQDNTLPVTSAAVHTVVGNIDALLSII